MLTKKFAIKEYKNSDKIPEVKKPRALAMPLPKEKLFLSIIAPLYLAAP